MRGRLDGVAVLAAVLCPVEECVGAPQQIIRRFAGRGQGDTVARLGGDEFAVLLDRADRRCASALASRLLSALAAPVPLGPATARITASAGVALAAPGETADDLLRRADALLYRAKHGGKNRYAVEAPAHEARA